MHTMDDRCPGVGGMGYDGLLQAWKAASSVSWAQGMVPGVFGVSLVHVPGGQLMLLCLP